MPESRCWMAADGVDGAVSESRYLTARPITDLKATAVEELLNHSEPALIAHSVNIDSHLSFVS
jgi:hypothetical protein